VNLVGDLQPGRQPPSYEIVMDCIKSKFNDMTEYLKTELSLAEHVCATADAWSDARCSFLGMTAHILNDQLERKSFALACRRLYGSHTYLALAEAVEQVLTEFKIQDCCNCHRQWQQFLQGI